MKQLNSILLFFAAVFSITTAAGQANASINILTQNSGLINTGGTVFVEVSVGNTGPVSAIGVYKIKTQISVPSELVDIPATGHNLPAGWKITSNNGSTINLSNGTDAIAVNEVRTILIAIHANAIGGPLTVAGGLSFSNGNSPGTAPGILTGDNTADNISTSSIQVTTPTPVTLTDFNVTLTNCKPVLNWTTETEINSSRYEIERANKNSFDWISIGVVAARGNSSAKVKYSLIDNTAPASSERVLYRLKIIDKDGHYKYSDVLPVYINCKTTQVYVYPNPVQKGGNLYISLTGSTEHTEAALVSLSGQVILKTNLHNGTNSLNVSRIANGEYILNVNTAEPGMSKKIKVVLQH